MPYISLYRKYRPKTFKDVVGQNVIVKILQNSIINNKIAHAYIFSGPRGTGKTSVAKIFAKAVNCLNNNGDVCNKCDICKVSEENQIDIIEIDAASNNGVEEIREIKNTIKLLPSVLKYKVYIIDEVHMLSTSAFNALLKTLEEPPAHAIFILATTEINKIPQTVLSRCQKFDFKKIKKSEIVDRLNYIIKEEKIIISEDIVDLIAELSDGGLRDAINLLDQVNSLNKKEITRTDVLNLIGYIDTMDIFNLFDSIISYNIKNVLQIINNYYETGQNFLNVVISLENVIKDIIIYNNTDNYFNTTYEDILSKYCKIDYNLLINITKDLFELTNELKKGNNLKIISEIYLLKITLYFKPNQENVSININYIDNKMNNETYDESFKIDESEKDILINNVLFGADKELKNEFLNKYNDLNDYLTDKNYNYIANLLLKATPEVVSSEIILFTFKNNFEIVLFDKNINEIVDFLKLMYNKKYKIVSISSEKWNEVRKEYINNINLGKKYEYIDDTPKESKKSRKKQNELQKNVENIFGEDYIIEE